VTYRHLIALSALFAHLRPTLRPGAAGRLVVPAMGSRRNRAPRLASVFASYWGDFWGYPSFVIVGHGPTTAFFDR
jgi:hypothetical protein